MRAPGTSDIGLRDQAAQSMAVALDPLHSELRALAREARAARYRTRRQWAEDEIVLPPDGPTANERFRSRRQPFTGLFLDAVDSGRWTEINMTGPSQSGKTLTGSVIPVLYHLFELRENVIFGLPDENMAADKWREVLLPAIERTRYKDLIPKLGQGSRGGDKFVAIKFANGATLRFMTGGGRDKQRAGFTARVLVISEADGMDEAGTTSREANKVAQLKARTKAFSARTGRPPLVYSECTVSWDTGYTWQTHQRGTCTRIVLPCPHCGHWVTPEREHLRGWQDAPSEVDAYEQAHFCCPACGQAWTEDARDQANRRALEAHALLHRGQEIVPLDEWRRSNEGKPPELADPIRQLDEHWGIIGPLPKTFCFSLRYSAVNNILKSAGDFAAGEWVAARATDQEAANREQCQFVWATPPPRPEVDVTPLDPQIVGTRMHSAPRGYIPDEGRWLTMAIDVGKWALHWLGIAWREDATGHVFDYGIVDVHSEDRSERDIGIAVLMALREFRDRVVLHGWASARGPRIPDQVWVDSRYQAPAVLAFCRESRRLPALNRECFRPTLGFGAGQQRTRPYMRPRSTGTTVLRIGEEYHFVRLKDEFVVRVEVNADYWKDWVHQRSTQPLTLFQAMPDEHIKLSHHLTAEVRRERFVAGKGLVVTWDRVRRQNHWLDCAYNAAAAGHCCGARLVPDAAALAAPVAPPPPRTLRMPDGRPFFITER